MKVPRHAIAPAALTIYLIGMAIWCYPAIQRGELSSTQFWATIAVTAAVIIALFFIGRRRNRLRNERLDDIKNNSNKQ